MSILSTRQSKSGDGSDTPISVLFVGSTRFCIPPEPTLQKKWRMLRPFFQATVIAFREGPCPIRASLEGSSWILVPSRLPRIIRYCYHFLLSFFFSFYGALTKRYEAVIAQSPYEARAPAIALLPWKIAGSQQKPRLIVEIHSDWKEGVMIYQRSRYETLEKSFRHAVGKFSLSQADSYRAISEYCRELLPKDQKPVYIFPTYTDLDSFHEPSQEILREVNSKAGEGFLIYIGMLIYLKGVHLLIQAFKEVLAKHPGARLIVAGKGVEEDSLKDLASKLGIKKNIDFVGYLEQDTLAAYLKNARALALPSLSEGLGRVAIEAHLLGKPVVGSRVGGIPEIVSDGETGLLVEPGDVESLGNALIKILDNPGLADSMGKAGKEAVKNKFNYQTYYRSYYDMVRETCRR